jgi:hypothetical protein
VALASAAFHLVGVKDSARHRLMDTVVSKKKGVPAIDRGAGNHVEVEAGTGIDSQALTQTSWGSTLNTPHADIKPMWGHCSPSVFLNRLGLLAKEFSQLGEDLAVEDAGFGGL